MTIILTGGGSGGHITPLLAVAHELKKLNPDDKLIYVGQRGDNLADIPAKHPDIDEAYTVRAGKLRRYSGEGVKQLLDIRTDLKNIRDGGRVVTGYFDSYRLLKRLKPDIIFIKGGFVGVPIGLAAAKLGIPFITHDSDAVPGLANRIISRWARAHAVALPKEIYHYPPNRTFSVGVPINHHFEPVSDDLKTKYRRELGVSISSRVVFITGGGNGARQLNSIVASSARAILNNNPDVVFLHLTGSAHTVETEKLYAKTLTPEQMKQVIIKGFVDNLYCYSGAADVIIGRGSATNLAEFAMQAKACIIIPARQLPWTVKNTEALASDNAVISLSEDELLHDPTNLVKTCNDLLISADKRRELSNQLSKALVHSDSAHELAMLILDNTKSN